MKATIFDIQRNSYVDGPGIRTTVFFKGCPLRCRWCHSPESQRREKQIMFYREKCVGCGRCRGLTARDTDFICYSGAKEICGREYTVDEVLDIVLSDRVFYETSGGGATFSGGECMMQPDFLEAILKKCKENGISTAVDTSGYAGWKNFERIIPYTDLFLYDLKCYSEELHADGTGVSNKPILENLEKLSKTDGCDIIIRIPVVPGFNTDGEELEKMARFVKGIRHRSVELLPYNKMGKFKYDALGMKFTGYEAPVIDDRLRELFK